MHDPEKHNEIEHRGGYAGAQTIGQIRRHEFFSMLWIGIEGGLVAGAFLAVFEIIVATMFMERLVTPFRLAASILEGQVALLPTTSAPNVILIGLISHFAIAAFWGGIFGIFARSVRKSCRAGLCVMLGIVYGLIVWFIDFYILAPIFWPWFMNLIPIIQAVLHALAYGLPLGMIVGSAAHLRTRRFHRTTRWALGRRY